MRETTMRATGRVGPQGLRRPWQTRPEFLRSQPLAVQGLSRAGEPGKAIGNRERANSVELHPLIYRAIAGLAIWYVISAWGLGRDGGTAYVLTVATGFIIVAVALPWIFVRVWRNNRAAEAEAGPTGFFADWATREFQTWSGPIKGGPAAVQILSPIAAVAFGMTALVVATQIAGYAK